MRLRLALQSDIPEMMSLADLSPAAAHWPLSAYARIFAAQPRRPALVAEDSAQKIVGFIVGISISAEDGWEIENIVVASAHQRAGVGSKLLWEFINLANQEKTRRMFLEVRASNASAIALYGKFGFAKIGIRKNYYSNPTENAVILALNLLVAR
jgi:[ribosomal protein S18]-alanine N-acetyltransferase